MDAAAIVAIVLLVVLGAFQVALGAGAPWGAAAYGGIHRGVLPRGLRINGLVFGLGVYPLIIAYVVVSSGLAEISWLSGAGSVAMWVAAAFFAVGTAANAASRSKVERIWAPVTLVIAVCCVVIALG